MKRVVVILISILIVGLGAFCTYYTISVENKRTEEKELKEKINQEYDLFKKSVEEFSIERDNVYSVLTTIDYLENIPKIYNNLVGAYKKYEEKLDKVVSNGDLLKEDLLGKEFKNKDLSSKQDAYVTNYEQSYNYFVSDVKKLNSQLELYNKMVEADTTKSFKKLDLYEAKYKELIDLNEDGIFSGIDKE